MKNGSRTLERLIWGIVGATVLGITLAFIWKQSRPSQHPLPVYGQVPDFTLTNQHGTLTTLADLRGQVWLADIIFTRCGGPCPQMSREMAALAQALPEKNGFRLVSLTADPEYDSPGILKKYALDFQGTTDRWLFLTGAKPDVYALALEGLKLAVQESNQATNINEMFIHSTVITLVDQQGRLRGFYPALEPATHETVVAAVNRLLREN